MRDTACGFAVCHWLSQCHPLPTDHYIMSNSQYILILATILAVKGIWLLLPRGAAWGKAIGAILTAVAFGLGASQMPYLADWLAQSVFSILAGVTVIAAVATISFRNPVYCAIWFGLTLLGAAGLLLLTAAQFLAVATIVIYAGAILVTFLFVLMLAQTEGNATYDSNSWEALSAAATGVVIVGILTITISSSLITPAAPNEAAISAPSAENLSQGVLSPYHVASIGMELFSRYLIAVEVAGLLLLAAIVGAAVIVAQIQKPHITNKDLPSKT
jgi:NADH-quinone oxidoreductase subunit J